jgi:hypothetical protein
MGFALDLTFNSRSLTPLVKWPLVCTAGRGCIYFIHLFKPSLLKEIGSSSAWDLHVVTVGGIAICGGGCCTNGCRRQQLGLELGQWQILMRH